MLMPLLFHSAAFQFDFGALNGSKNEVLNAFDNMFADSQLYPSTLMAIFRATFNWWPKWLLHLVEFVPSREFQRLRSTRNFISKVSTGLVDNATQEAKTVEIEKGKKDVMSVLGESHVVKVSLDDVTHMYS
jgi:alkylphenol/PAH-inducible cytochrome P450 monooxygenase